MSTYVETIELEDKVTPAATTAQAAVAQLGTGLAAANKTLAPGGGLGAGMTHLGKSTFDASNAITVGKETIAAAMSGIHQAFTSLAEGDIKGAIAGVTDAIAGMSKMLDLVVPGLGEVVSAVVKIAGGAVGIFADLIVGGAKFAVASAQAKLAMISQFDAMGQGKITGEELDDMLTGLSNKIGIAKDSLAPLTKAFLQMGITGKDQLEQLTLAAISANATVGEGGAEAFETLFKKVNIAGQTGGTMKLDPKFIKGLAAAGLTVNDLAKGFGKTGAQLKGATVDASKLGDVMTKAIIAKAPLSQFAASFGEIKKKFDSDLGDLFEDIDIKPFMAAIKDLMSIFASDVSKGGKASGDALKAGIGGFFKEVFALATAVVPMIKHFLLDLVIYGLMAYIALKPIVTEVFAKIGTESVKAKAMIGPFVTKLSELWTSASNSGLLMTVLKGLGVALLAVVGVVALVVGFFVGMAAIAAVVGLAIWALIGTIIAFGVTIADKLIGAGVAVITWLMGLGVSINDALGGWPAMAVQAAMDFISGLVNGITQGASLVADAAKGVASGAVNAVEGFLGIKSPSTVMAEIGGHTATGMAQGIEGGMGDVHGAASGLATAAVGGASGGGAPAGGASGSSIQVTNYFTIEGAGATAQEITTELVSLTFESMALAQGV